MLSFAIVNTQADIYIGAVMCGYVCLLFRKPCIMRHLCAHVRATLLPLYAALVGVASAR